MTVQIGNLICTDTNYQGLDGNVFLKFMINNLNTFRGINEGSKDFLTIQVDI